MTGRDVQAGAVAGDGRISLTFDPWEMARGKLGKCDSVFWQNDLRCTPFVYNCLDVMKTKNKNPFPTDEPKAAVNMMFHR